MSLVTWQHWLADLHGVAAASRGLACLVFALYLVLQYLKPWRRRPVPYRAIVWVVAWFLFFCGVSACLDRLSVQPAGPLPGAIAAVMAAASWMAILVLACLVARAQAPCDPFEFANEMAERRRTQAELMRVNARLNAVLDASTQVSIIATDPDGLITVFNPGAERMLGYTAEEMVGKATPLQLHDPQEVEIHAELLAAEFGTPIAGFDAFVERARRGGHDVGEWTYVRKDGSRLTVQLAVTAVVDPEGRINGFLGIATDLSERKRLEDQLRNKASELAQADVRKNEFLAMLGHELRNPLAPIRNAVKIMKQRGSDDPALCWARDVIDHQMRQMAQLVDDLLEISRVTRGKVRLQKEIVTVETIIQFAVETSRPIIDAHRHRFSMALPSPSILVDADPVRMAQVLSNLLNNAAKYTQDGGQIHLAAYAQGEEAVFEVRDSGIGIPAEMLARVFDLFAQADRSLDRSQGGLGLGLTLVKRLVEMHDGTVFATSAGVNQGSQFIVRLPLWKTSETMGQVQPPTPASSPGQPGIAAPPSHPRKVLVVDDNVASARSLELLLALDGHEVHVVFDGPAALEAIDQHHPEVVLMDIGLPGMNGYDVARTIRHERALGDPLLVAITGYAEDEARRRSRDAGFHHHLVKPVNPDAILNLLAALERPAGAGALAAGSPTLPARASGAMLASARACPAGG